MGSILLLACSAIAAVLAIAVRIQLGGPVIFCHRRAGQHGRIFPLYKFRTLTNACDRQGRLLPDRYRMTRLGASLRRLSLDELPQLWNVLRGDMEAWSAQGLYCLNTCPGTIQRNTAATR